MMQEVIGRQSAYQYLNSKPVCVSTKAHCPPYESDGDYFSKPNPEDIIDALCTMMTELNPNEFPN